ncbi:MAG: hypothetical protein IKB02_09875 [Clostridia bacterium]|nr:hypothetical protein [Clostridia bacterium]MBR2389041.1 hypothetical protein [Clostridia bacterium]
MSTVKDILDIELIETVALFTELSKIAACQLQHEVETHEHWRQKSTHMRAIKHFSEALEVMATNSTIHTVKEWVLYYENQRGMEWCNQWGDWFWNAIEQSVMYAMFVIERNERE